MIVSTPVYLGDYYPSDVVRFMWNSQAAAGGSVTRATNGTISVYKDNNTSQSTSGVTDTEDFDSLTGVHYCAVDTSSDGTFYSSGSTFSVVLSGATIDGLTINSVLAVFTIGHGVNTNRWNGTAVATPDTAGFPKVTIKDGTGTGELDTSSGGVIVASIANGAITAASIASDAITDAKVASDVTIASVTGAVGSVTGNVGGNVVGSVGSVASGGITAASIATDAFGALELASDAVAEIADAVWDEARSGHTTAGTFGESFAAIYSGSVTGAATVSSLIDSALTQTDTGHWIGRTVVFITGSLAGQATTINGFNATLDRITFTQLTSSPSTSDRYVIV